MQDLYTYQIVSFEKLATALKTRIRFSHNKDHLYFLNIPGHYMYIETSFPRKRGQKARLASGTITQTGPACVSFYYHMYGRSMGSLNIYVKEQTSSGSSNLGQPVWRRQGNQQNRWIKGQFAITPSQSFQVRTILNEPRSEKTGLRGLRPGPTQTRLNGHRRWLEA